MIDINLIRKNPDLVRENIKKKFQDHKLPLIDTILELDAKVRDMRTECDNLRASRNSISNEIGALMRNKQVDEANAKKQQVGEINANITNLEAQIDELGTQLKQHMMTIPNIIDDSVPVGKDDNENVEIEKFGEPVVPEYEIPYNADILEGINGLDKESAGRTSGNGFYYLLGDAARLHEAMIAYARDYMIDKG
ncbi:MAG: serine--tRNA ligase, partial [Clostridia bacterium]|nr:serine--tRNA ligase [Clostridia bacterium]